MWFIYILVSDVTTHTYVGCTVDVHRRLRQHNGEIKGGAKRTRCGRPWSVSRIYGPYPTRSDAQKVECAIKKLRGRKRLEYSSAKAV